MDFNLLEEALKNCDMELLEEIIDAHEPHELSSAVPLFIRHLRETEDPALRNTIAVALRDIGDEAAVLPLIELLNHPKTLNNRGTLLYALEVFDCSAHLKTIVHLFLSGGFEVQATAYQLLESMAGEVPDEFLLAALLQVKEQLNEIERQQALHSDVLELLYNLKLK